MYMDFAKVCQLPISKTYTFALIARSYSVNVILILIKTAKYIQILQY